MAYYLSPTRAELNAGTNLTPEVSSSGNWGIVSGAIDTPDLATTFTSQIPGQDHRRRLDAEHVLRRQPGRRADADAP